MLRRIAHFQTEHPFISVLLIALLTVAMFGGVEQVRTVASLEQMMPKDLPEIKAFNTLRDTQHGKDLIAVVVRVDPLSTDAEGVIDVRDKRVHDYLVHLSGSISSETDVLATYSYADVLAEYGSTLSDEEYDALMDNAYVKEMLRDFVNDDASVTLLLASTDVSTDDARMQMLATRVMRDVDSAGHPPGVKIEYTGTPVIQQKLGELIEHDRTSTQWISTLLVFMITLLIFGSFTSALVPIIVVTISVNWLYGTMGYNDLPISTLAGGVAAMVIGIGIDFAIHIMNKFKYERKKGLSIKNGIEMAVVDTGTALTATSVTTIAAFLAFLSGAMPEMGRFGILMAIGIGYALFFSLFGLPALLVIEEKIIYWLKDKVRFGVERELYLETESPDIAKKNRGDVS